jgi:hypothetical protein
MAVQKVNVSVDQSKLDRFADVVAEIRRAGMKVEQELDAIGVVTGSIDSDKIDQLRKVAGVAAVEPEHTFQIPDRRSRIQ